MTTTRQGMKSSRDEAPVSESILARNTGLPLDMGWIDSVHSNRSAIERLAATLMARRTVKKEWQVAWLLRAITCIDLTALSGDDTPGNVRRLCAKARQPLRQELIDDLGFTDVLHIGAVCVYHNLVATSIDALRGSGIPVAAV